MDRFVIEIGMGVDFHGQDVTKAAVKAAKDAISKSCLIGLDEVCGFTQDNIDDNVIIDVTIGVTRPDEVMGGSILKITNEQLKEMYFTMLKIRKFELSASDLFAQGKIPGFVHLYIGEEAVATGACANLREDDYITSTHRGHGHIIAKGGELKYMMAELFG